MQPMRSKRASFFFLVPFFCWVLFLTFGVFALRFAASAVAVALGYLLQVSCRPHFLYRKGRHYYHFFFDDCFRIAVLVPAFFSLGFSHLNLIWFFSHFWRYEALWDAVWRCVLFDPLLEGEHDASFRSYVDFVFLDCFFFLSASKNNNGKSKDHWNGELDDLRRKSPQLMGMRSVNGRCSWRRRFSGSKGRRLISEHAIACGVNLTKNFAICLIRHAQ